MTETAEARVKRLSMRSLFTYLGYLESNGLDDSIYLSALWEKLIYHKPLALK